MTSSHQCRYALWFHESQFPTCPVNWRQTPRSKNYTAVNSTAVLATQVLVLNATDTHITLQISQEQANQLSAWACDGLPTSVLPPTALESRIIDSHHSYICIDHHMRCTEELPKKGDMVYVRVHTSIRKTGPIYKAVLQVTDVLRPDVSS